MASPFAYDRAALTRYERSIMAISTKNLVAKSLSKVKPDHESKVTEAFRRALNG